jgi:hypothetical protein
MLAVDDCCAGYVEEEDEDGGGGTTDPSDPAWPMHRPAALSLADARAVTKHDCASFRGLATSFSVCRSSWRRGSVYRTSL